MRICVLGGAGRVGRVVVRDLLRSGAREVLVTDISPAVHEFARSLEDQRVSSEIVDVSKPDEVRRALKEFEPDVVCNCAIYTWNVEVTRVCIELGVSCVDPGGSDEITMKQLKLREEARRAGVTVIPDIGLSPGISNVLVRDAVESMDAVDEVRIYVGGIPERRENPPWNYWIVYAPEAWIDMYTVPALAVEDHEVRTLEPLSDYERIVVPGIGELEAFATEGLSTLAMTMRARVKRMIFKTLRWPGHADAVRALKVLGLFDTTPVEVRTSDGRTVSIRPRDFLLTLLRTYLTRKDIRDVVVMLIRATGTRGGKRVAREYFLLQRYYEPWGALAMSYTTGIPVSVTAQMIVRGVIEERGVFAPEEVIPPREFLSELKSRGISVEVREVTPQ